MDIKRAYRFRFYPSPEQEIILARTFGCARFAYNHMLRQRTDAWMQRQEKMGYHESSAALTNLKKQPEYAWLNKVSSVPVQQALRHLQTAFANFFAKRNHYPQFKRKDGKQSAEYTTSAFKWDGQSLKLAKMDAPLEGRELVGIDKWYPSSKRCSDCGYTAPKMPLNVRQWTCSECGSIHDRDINAARNVLAAGLAARGEAVSPVSL